MVEGRWKLSLTICTGHSSIVEVIVVLFALALALYWIFYFTSITKETKQREYEDEQRRIYSKKYQNSHPDKEKSFWDQPKPLPIASDIRKLVLQKTKGLCFYCLKDMNNSLWEVDHVWPRRYGGSEELVNLVPSCGSCNGIKYTKIPVEYFIEKWATKGRLNHFEISFIDFYRTNSMAAIVQRGYWKGICDYWLITKYGEFADLVSIPEGIVGRDGRNKKLMINKAQDLLDFFDGPGDRWLKIWRIVERAEKG